MSEFVGFPKIPRLRRDVVITEKIDGTNGCVVISDEGDVFAQSRNRIITQEADNHGFAKWVAEHSSDLAEILGPGRHFGEWWGCGIQRGYGLDHKRFSLFNVSRWADMETDFGLYAVPVIGEGVMGDDVVTVALHRLRIFGSSAAPGYDRPEGIVVYHKASNGLFKVTIEGDEAPKTAA